MTRHKILIVEDEESIRDMTRFSLEKAGFDVVEADGAHRAQIMVVDEQPDLILLDWMLPGGSGLELARRWKREGLTQDVPVIMVTARAEEDDKVRGLESGADDYLTKPFSPRELVARIKAVLRRSSGVNDEGRLEVGGLVLDSASHRVMVDDRNVAMGPTEYRLLQFFMSHPERVYSRSQLLDRIWGGNVYLEERTVDVHIRRLRKALEEFSYDGFIQTVRGAGYRFSSRL